MGVRIKQTAYEAFKLFTDVHFSERYILVSALEETVSTLLSERERMVFLVFFVWHYINSKLACLR